MEELRNLIAVIFAWLAYVVWAVAALYGFYRVALDILRTVIDIRSQRDRRASRLDEYAKRLEAIMRGRIHYLGDQYPSSVPETEKEFYIEFSNRLREAKVAIYNSGDGFNMALRAESGDTVPQSADYADIMDEAIIQALDGSPDLHYHRFQITSACNINWVSRLIYMKNRFPRRVHVFMNPAYDHLGCFCAIDPERNRCTFEWQILSERHYLKGHITKGFGFIYANKAICRKLALIFDNHIGRNRSDEMDVERLRVFQKKLWYDRIRRMKDETGYDPGDPEIHEAFDEANLNRNKFEAEMLPFPERKFAKFEYDLPRQRVKSSGPAEERHEQ